MTASDVSPRRPRERTARVMLVVVALTGLLAWYAQRAWAQNELNYRLSDACGRRDLPEIQRLLRSGADPNAPWSGYTFRDRIRRIFRQTPFDVDISILRWECSVADDREVCALLRKDPRVR